MWTSAFLMSAALAMAQPPAEEEILSRIALAGESGRTARRIAAVDKLTGEKKWTEALEELQRILTEAADDLIPIDGRHSIQARWLCHLRLAALPAGTLRLYRSRVDSQARKWLEEGSAARDIAILRRIVEESFCSKFTDQALDLLGDLAFERGAFGEAERSWRMIVLPASKKDTGPDSKDALIYPDPQVDIARARAKQILARLFQGEHAAAIRELQAFQAEHAKASGHLAGRNGNYAEILQAVAARPEALADPPAPEAWRTYAGAPSRSFVLPQAKGRLDQMPQLNGPQWTIRLDSGEPVLETPDEPELGGPDARKLAFYPLIVGDRVLVADAQHVSAYELQTGRRVLHYDLTNDPKVGDLSLRLKLPAEPYLSYTLTAAGQRVYARLGAQSIGPRRGGKTPSFLVCLDLQLTHGKIDHWLVKAQALDGANAMFEGAPVVHAGRVYVAVTRLAAVQTQTAIACYSADTGIIRWQRDVCETQELKEDERRYRHHLLTLAGDSIVYCSHSGAIVSLDAESGRRQWALRYPSRGPNTAEGVPSRRGLAPCLFAGGRLFVAPMDYNRILCLDLDTGHQLWEDDTLEVVHLLGVVKERLIMTAVKSTNTGLPLQHNLLALDVSSGNLKWQKPDDGQTGLATVGQGLLAGDRVYWPTSTGLIVVDQEWGEFVTSDKRIQGNLAAADGCLAAAGTERLTVYIPAAPMLKNFTNSRASSIRFRVPGQN